MKNIYKNIFLLIPPISPLFPSMLLLADGVVVNAMVGAAMAAVFVWGKIPSYSSKRHDICWNGDEQHFGWRPRLHCAILKALAGGRSLNISDDIFFRSIPFHRENTAIFNSLNIDGESPWTMECQQSMEMDSDTMESPHWPGNDHSKAYRRRQHKAHVLTVQLNPAIHRRSSPITRHTATDNELHQQDHPRIDKNRERDKVSLYSQQPINGHCYCNPHFSTAHNRRRGDACAIVVAVIFKCFARHSFIQFYYRHRKVQPRVALAKQ